MEKINSLEGLLLHEVKDLYHAEQQLVKALPKVAKKASSPETPAPDNAAKSELVENPEEQSNHQSGKIII